MLNILDEIATTSTICGGIEIPNTAFNMVALVIKIIKIAVPILLVIFGMLDFAKSVVAKKEEDIKQYRKNFIARLISAVAVFLVITVTQLVIGLVNGVEKQSNVEGQTTGDIWACCKKFINGVDVETPTDEETNTN